MHDVESDLPRADHAGECKDDVGAGSDLEQGAAVRAESDGARHDEVSQNNGDQLTNDFHPELGETFEKPEPVDADDLDNASSRSFSSSQSSANEEILRQKHGQRASDTNEPLCQHKKSHMLRRPQERRRSPHMWQACCCTLQF